MRPRHRLGHPAFPPPWIPFPTAVRSRYRRSSHLKKFVGQALDLHISFHTMSIFSTWLSRGRLESLCMARMGSEQVSVQAMGVTS